MRGNRRAVAFRRRRAVAIAPCTDDAFHRSRDRIQRAPAGGGRGGGHRCRPEDRFWCRSALLKSRQLAPRQSGNRRRAARTGGPCRGRLFSRPSIRFSTSAGLPARNSPGSAVASRSDVANCIGVSARRRATANSFGRGGVALPFPPAGAGISPAQHQSADDPAQFVSVLRGVAGQPLQQLGVARRVLGVHLVQWHHQTVAEKLVPEPVHDRPREKVALPGLEHQIDQLRPGAELRQRRLFLPFETPRRFFFRCCTPPRTVPRVRGRAPPPP